MENWPEMENIKPFRFSVEFEESKQLKIELSEIV